MDTIPQFNSLPLELRRNIWMQCLPRRIVEEDFPYTLLDGKESRQACWPRLTTFQNARVPVIASVCHESRQVALQWGQQQESQDVTSLTTVWLQPKIDNALHINWTRRRSRGYFQVYDAWDPDPKDSPLVMLIVRARWDYDMPFSLAGEVAQRFDLEELMAEPAATMQDSASSDHGSATSDTPCLALSSLLREERAYHVSEVVDIAEQQPIHMTLMAVSLHVDREKALASGLFGLLGDAPVQTVNFDDTTRLRQFYHLYKSDGASQEAEPYIERLFNMMRGPRFHEAVLSWRDKVMWLTKAIYWKWVRDHNAHEFPNSNPGIVWSPHIPNDQLQISMDEFMPDEKHPWWAEHAAKITPNVVPQVMVRLCDNQCYRKERLPKYFGEADFIPEAWISQLR